MTSTVAIKTFFEKDGGRPLQTSELIELRKANPLGYNEIADLCAAALGGTIDARPGVAVAAPSAS